MKKTLATLIAFAAFLITISAVNAQMMGGFSNSTVDWEEVVGHTVREEKEGKGLWDKLQAKEVTCADLNNEQFGVLG